MDVRKAMTAPAVQVPPDESLLEVVGRLLEAGIGSVLVETGQLGIVTDRDVLRAGYRRREPLSELTARDAMTTGLVTVAPDSTLETAVERMERHEIKKLPVVEDFELLGILTMTDVAEHLPEQVREARSTIERRDDWTDD